MSKRISVDPLMCECGCGGTMVVTTPEYDLCLSAIKGRTGNSWQGRVVIHGHTVAGHCLIYQNKRFDVLVQEQ